MKKTPLKTFRESALAQMPCLFISPDHEISVLNEFLSILGESHIINRKLDTRALYVQEKKSRAAVGKRCIDQQRQARLLKQADMWSSIESQAQVGWEVIACFLPSRARCLGSNCFFLDRLGRDAWELKGLTNAKIASRL